MLRLQLDPASPREASYKCTVDTSNQDGEHEPKARNVSHVTENKETVGDRELRQDAQDMQQDHNQGEGGAYNHQKDKMERAVNLNKESKFGNDEMLRRRLVTQQVNLTVENSTNQLGPMDVFKDYLPKDTSRGS